MKVAVSTNLTREFIPEWNGNRELSEVEQIKVYYKAPSISIKEDLAPLKFDLVPSKDKYDEKGNPVMEQKMTYVLDRTKIINKLVTAISGLSVECDGKEVQIKNASQLLSAGVELDELVSEIFAHLQSILNNKVIDEKN